VIVAALAGEAVVSGNMTDVMDECCKNAKVTKYDNDCGIYCLAQGLGACGCGCGGRIESSVAEDIVIVAALAGEAGLENAAIANQPISKSGVGLIALLFGSALMAVIS
jgi:hypothetical protein